MNAPIEPNTLNENLLGEVAGDFFQRLAAGESPTVAEYAERYPEIAEQIRLTFPALELVGESLSSSGSSTDGRAVTPKLGDKQIGDFVIGRELGRGGMGVVYEAQQISLNRRVALKVLPFAGALDHRQLQRFKMEAQAAALLHHQNIVPVFGIGSDRGVHFYAMQLIDGQTLAEVIGELSSPIDPPIVAQPSAEPKALASGLPIATSPPVKSEASVVGSSENVVVRSANQRAKIAENVVVRSANQRARIAERSATNNTSAFIHSVAELGIQAADALEHAHGEGVIHRDIKPSNLILDEHGKLWVTDFGLALVEASPGLTMTGDLVGTLRYMSPEQALARRVLVDQRTDIYSLCATLYELLTLQPVLAGEDRQELIKQIAFEEPTRPRKINRSIPAELETILLKGLEKNPQDRYATAAQLADDLRRLLDDRPILAKPPSLLNKTAKWSRRHRTLVNAAAILLVFTTIVLSISNVLITRERNQKTAALTARTTALGEKDEALAESQQSFEQALQAVDQMLTRVADESLLGVPRMTPVRMQLFDDAIRFYQELLTDRPSDTRLRYKLAVVQFEVATVANQIVDYDVALPSAEASLKNLEQLVEGQPMDPTYAGALAESLRIAAEIRRFHLGDLDAMVSYNQRGAEIARRAGASMARARSLAALAWGHNGRADSPAAIETLKEAIPLLQSSFDESTGNSERNLGFAYHTLGNAYRNLRDYTNAVDALQSAVTAHKKVLELRPESLSAGQEQMYALYGLAQAFKKSGDTESAITVYREGLEFSLKLEKRFPASRQCDSFICFQVRELCPLLRSSGKETEIRSMIDGLAPITSNDFTVRGVLHSSLGDTDSATEDLTRAMEINPKNWAPTQKLVTIHVQNGDGEKAVELHRTLMRIASHISNPYDWQSDLQRLAAMQCRLGDLEEARRSLIWEFEKNSRIDFKSLMNSEDKLLSEQYLLAAESFFELNPTRLDAHVLRSTIQAACGKIVDAEKSFASIYEMVDQLQWSDEMNDATKNDRIDACGILMDAFSVWNENDRSDLARKTSDYSMTLASKLRRQFPDDAGIEVVEKHAEHLYRNLAPKDAIAELSRLIDEMGAFSALYRYRGCAFRDIKRFDEALTDLDRAIELLPDDGDLETYESRGILFVEMKQYEKAIADYDKYVELSSKNQNAQAHFVRGEFYLNVVKNYKQAIIDFDFALEKTPHYGHWYKRRAVALFGLKRFDEALADLNTCLDCNPGDTSTLTWIGTKQIANCSDEAFRTGMRTLADRAVELNDQSSNSLSARAALLAALGHKDRAIADYDKVIELKPDNASMFSARAALHAALGNYDDARLDFQKAITPDNGSYLAHYYHALLCGWMNDEPAYRQACSDFVEQFRESDEAMHVNFAAWTCVLAPNAVTDYAPALALAQLAVESEPKNQQYLGGLGAVQMRAGEYDQALASLDQAAGSDESSNTSSAYIAYFRAMTEQHLELDHDARQSLAHANQLADKELSDAAKPPKWNRKLTLQLLRTEAESLIGSADTETSQPTEAIVTIVSQ